VQRLISLEVDLNREMIGYRSHLNLLVHLASAYSALDLVEQARPGSHSTIDATFADCQLCLFASAVQELVSVCCGRRAIIDVLGSKAIHPDGAWLIPLFLSYCMTSSSCSTETLTSITPDDGCFGANVAAGIGR